MSWFILTCLFLLKYFVWHCSYERGREEKGGRATLIFLKASLSVPVGLSLCRLHFPSHPWAAATKIARTQSLAECPGMGFYFFNFIHHLQPAASRHQAAHHLERKGSWKNSVPMRGLGCTFDCKEPVLSAHAFSTNKGEKYTWIKTFLFLPGFVDFNISIS